MPGGGTHPSIGQCLPGREVITNDSDSGDNDIMMMQACLPQRLGLRGRQRGLPEPGIHRGAGLYNQVGES